jgi:membrane protease YdiL (CAAX protease family)
VTAELSEPRADWPRWPLWAPLAGGFVGIAAAILIMGVVSGVLRGAGVHVGSNSPGFTAAFTFVQDVAVVIGSVGIAALTLRPRREQFGLRPAPLRFAAGIAFMGVAAFYLFALIYQGVVQPDNPQRIVDDLGADKNTLLLVTGALTVIVIAPVCEEIFFRGFVYRVLRVRASFWVAALIDGVLFGLVHGVNVVLPVLIFLGVVLCWVFERTGTLFATIAIHALNNTIAYGASADHGWAAAAPIGAAVLTGCALLARLLPRGRAPAPA